MKKGILFDLDGTLLDSLEDLHHCVNYALRQYGCPERSLAEIRRFVGNGARRLVEQSLPGTPNDPPLDQVFSAYQTYYNANCKEGSTRPYPGIVDALTVLKDRYPIAVVSNKPHDAVVELCREFFPDVYALGVRPDCPRKPAPDMLRKAMEAIGVDTCLYVGDSEVDVLTAKNTGIPCLSVLWGFRDRQELVNAGATHFCENTAELTVLIPRLLDAL